MTKALSRYVVAERSLDEAKTIDAVSEVCGFYEGLRKAAHGMKDRKAEIEAAEFNLRAKRKLGLLMKAASEAGVLAKAGRKNRGKNTPIKPTLADAGVDKNLAKAARKLAGLSDDAFKKGIANWRREADHGEGRVATNLPEPPKEATGPSAKIRANNISLKEWEKFSADERREFLQPENFPTNAQFNEQKSGGIEWAQWSWNPVTGCRHDCPYCYARDIAKHYSDVYPHGFEPAFRPYMLNAPRNTSVPNEANDDTRFKNVFTCSMADLFGRWVPAEWINAVLSTVRENSQWNFLFLTKFPKRMSEFSIPPNAWMGTTVDLQARVANAEAAFARLNKEAGIRWLSVEPMLEPVKFNKLELFNWVVIGGASRSEKTPVFQPPLPWIIDLYTQAKNAGCAVYMKTNLLGNRVLELPFNAAIKGDPTSAPEPFHYLGKPELAA